MQDLLLAILVEQEPIKLAPSSSQIPALLARTKQNIFDVRAQQQAAQRYQQQRLQQRAAGPARAAAGAAGEAPSRRGSDTPQVPWQGLVAGVSVTEETAAAAVAAAGQHSRVSLVCYSVNDTKSAWPVDDSQPDVTVFW